MVALAVVAGCALAGFLVRELRTEEPILDLRVFRDRNFAAGACLIALVGLGLYSSVLLIALYTQKVLGYDAWTAGMVLAPGGIGNLISLVIAGRLVARVDQRGLLALGCALNAAGLYFMSNLTLGVDYWTLVWPRFVQGLGLGFTFVPLTTLALGTIPRDNLGNATSAYNVIRNLGGSAGVALAVTLLSRRSQAHQVTLVGHVNTWNPETAAGLKAWTDHFLAQGADIATAEGQALGMLYQRTLEQAQVLAYNDDFWLLALLFLLILFLLPLLRRVRAEPRDFDQARPPGRVEGLPIAAD
jgi:DHA2 family multidrug resistance protein